jgi:hypothetical protein
MVSPIRTAARICFIEANYCAGIGPDDERYLTGSLPESEALENIPCQRDSRRLGRAFGGTAFESECESRLCPIFSISKVIQA